MTDPLASFRALGTDVAVLTGDAASLEAATDAVRRELDAVDAACSRFRSDSELADLNRSAGRPVAVSALLLEAVEVARRGAALTQGLVDPTMGASMRALGYDRDFRSVPPDGPPLELHLPAVAGWRSVIVDREARTVTVPAGVELDLGATAKAWAVDRAAAAAARACPDPVLVSIGGDLAVGGPLRPDGWPVLVTDDHAVTEDPSGQTISIQVGGLATSGTTVRRWRRGEVELHHLIDPRSGRPIVAHWRTASVAAGSCVDANIASTASMILGPAAPAWLDARHLPARLVQVDGTVTTVAGWPAPDGTRPAMASAVTS